MKALKYNFKKHNYDEYELPEGTILFTNDMNKICSCASCGTKIEYGKSYTSLKIHNETGFGYPVCHECYTKELVDKNNNQ